MYYAVAAWRQPRPAAILAAILWLLYAVFEVLVAKAILCDEKCNIRIDLLLIWPMLWVASLFASKTPGKWSLRAKIFGGISLGSLLLSLVMFVLVYLESKDVFFQPDGSANRTEKVQFAPATRHYAKPPGT